MKETIIDIGSNSLKYLCVNKKDTSYEVIEQGAVQNRTGDQILQTRQFSQESIDQTCQCISEIQSRCSSFGIMQYYAIGTMSFRNAQNAGLMLETVKLRTGIDIRILSYQEEAELSYKAALSDFQMLDTAMIFNLGGGSTEIIYAENTCKPDSMSLDFGALILKNKFSNDRGYFCVNDCESYLFATLSTLKDYIPDKIIGMGGSVSSAIRLTKRVERYQFNQIHLQTIKLSDIEKMIAVLSNPDKYSETFKDFFLEHKYIPDSHRDIILPGLLIIKSILNRYQKEELTCNEKGLVFALIDEKLK